MGFNPFIGGGGGTSSEDKVARAEIAAIKDGETLDSFSDVETVLADKADITDIPTVPITAIQKNGTDIVPVSGTVNITVPTTAADVLALPDTTKYASTLSLTINSQTFVITGQLKDQNGDNLGTAQTIDLPLESVVVGGSYNSQTKKVVLTLQNGNTIEFSVADLVSGLQTELSETNKLNPAYIDYDSTHRAVSDTEKSTWNGKQNAIDSSHKLSADLVDDTNATNKFATAAQLQQIEANKNNISSLNTEIDAVANLGAKNLLDFETWASNITVYNGTKSYSNGVLTVTATGSDCTTYFNQYFPEVLKIPVKEGEKYIITWDTTVTTHKGFLQLCPNGNTTSGTDVNIANKQTEYTVASGVLYLTYRVGVWVSGNSINISKLMLRPASILDSTYQPYAMSNAALTEKEQNNESNISLYLFPTEIAGGTDLNSLATQGRYTCPSAATAQTLTNCPTTSAFTLEVKPTAGMAVNRYMQELYPNTDNEVYRRWHTATGWSSWYIYNGTVVEP